MTVESDIFDTLKGLVTNRVYPDAAPYGATRPFIVYTQIGGETINYVEGGVPDRKNGVFQINAHAATRAEASALMLLVEAAMLSTNRFSVEVQRAPMAEHDPDVPDYWAHQDFSIWSAR